MAFERTLSIIKPDAVAKNLIGVIDTRLENTGLRIVGAKMLHLAKQHSVATSTHAHNPDTAARLTCRWAF